MTIEETVKAEITEMETFLEDLNEQTTLLLAQKERVTNILVVLKASQEGVAQQLELELDSGSNSE
tara:strand:+ start:132 stop:326 length:195 start_codon:yes stop_codon:yes gene_type:complete